MKITIDTEEKKITIHDECNLLELINSLHKLFGDKLEQFKIEVPSKVEIVTKFEKEPYWLNDPNTFRYASQPYNNQLLYGGNTGTLLTGTSTGTAITTSNPYIINCTTTGNGLAISGLSATTLTNINCSTNTI